MITYALGLRPRDVVDLAVFALVDLAAAAFLGAVVPVTAFLAAPRLEGEVVFFFGAAVGFAVVFLTVLALVVVALAAGLAAGFVAGFAADFAMGFVAGLALVVDALVVLGLAFVGDVFAVLGLAVDLALDAGLFSLAEVSALTLGASFTFPLTPLGNTKVPFSAPVEMALAS